MSLAPRHVAGSDMSASAVTTAALLTTAGAATYGSGAIVSLALLGVMSDVAVRGARRGWRIYVALVLAGLLTNLLALGSRAATKVLGLDAGSRPFDSWWLQAIGTYAASGIVAGLLGAFCWFQFTDRSLPKPRA